MLLTNEISSLTCLSYDDCCMSVSSDALAADLPNACYSQVHSCFPSYFLTIETLNSPPADSNPSLFPLTRPSYSFSLLFNTLIHHEIPCCYVRRPTTRTNWYTIPILLARSHFMFPRIRLKHKRLLKITTSRNALRSTQSSLLLRILLRPFLAGV